MENLLPAKYASTLIASWDSHSLQNGSQARRSLVTFIRNGTILTVFRDLFSNLGLIAMRFGVFNSVLLISMLLVPVFPSLAQNTNVATQQRIVQIVDSINKGIRSAPQDMQHDDPEKCITDSDEGPENPESHCVTIPDSMDGILRNKEK